jgi:competence protein ComEC
VLGVVTSALSRAVGRRRAVPPAVVALALYTALVGADAAVVRAAIMGGIMLVGHYLGRPGQAVRALLAAAWLMTAYRPGYLQDLGFQLSFAATVGLVLLSPPLNSAVEAIMARVSGGRPAAALPAALRESVLVTMAAQLATWPVIARQVGQVSLAGLVANFLIVPAQSAVMILGSATALLGGVWSPLGRVPGALAWVPLAYTIRVVEASARLPLASVQSTAPDIGLAAYYLALAGLLTLGSRGLAAARGVMRRAASVLTRLPAVHLSGARWPLSAAAVVCVLAWSAALTQPDGLLHLHVLDVGQGDSLYVVTPSGRRMLVDGGPSPSAVLDGLGRAMAPWDRRLDVVVLTHPDLDHVCGLPSVLGRYRVAQVVEAATEAQSPEALAWREAVAAEGANRTVASVGTTILLDNRAGVRATVLWPPAEGPTVGADNVNNHSVVLRLDHGAVRMLLTGDIEEPVESALVASGADLRSAVLKVPHHGSDTSSSPGFLDAVAPWLAVISVGAGNSFGHPSPKVMARLGWLTVRRTDKNGPIDVISDGTGVWVK